jgi:hypothetical protein
MTEDGPGHWIGIAAAAHVRRAVADGFAMFSHGRHSAVARVLPGDRVTYYSPREGMKEGAEVRAFTAIGSVLEGPVGEREMFPGIMGAYRRVDWAKSAHPADIYPLLDRFSFVTDRSHWGMCFRKSLFRVPAADFALIADAMGVDLR